MTTEEFSNSFDVLLDSYANKALQGDTGSAADIDLDEYEKSEFLTEAQNILVNSYYNGNNSRRLSFEQTEEIRRYLDALVISKKMSSEDSSSHQSIDDESYSSFFTLPDNHLYTVYEAAVVVGKDGCKDSNIIPIVPVTHDEYYRKSRNPFMWAKKRAFRLNIEGNVVELVCKSGKVEEWILRYLRKPDPIILVDLPVGLTIDGKSVKTECELLPMFHQEILETAVRLALNSRVRTATK